MLNTAAQDYLDETPPPSLTVIPEYNHKTGDLGSTVTSTYRECASLMTAVSRET